MALVVRTLLATTAIGFLTLSPTGAVAQVGRISAVVAAPRHDLMVDPLVGASALVALPIGEGRRVLRVQGERVVGDARRTGVPCSGLAEPGTCSPEPVSDDARMTTVAFGLGFALLRGARLDAQLTADLRIGSIHADTRGLVSGRELSAGKSIWGGDLGLQASWSPWARMPLALEGGFTLGALRPMVREEIVDGYTPFNNGFAVRRLSVGAAWRRGTPR